MSESASGIRRLLLALDAISCGTRDWEAAMDLAALIGAEIEGLFVEDTDLLGFAALPIAREVGRLSGQSRPLARASLESVLRRRVERSASELQHAGKRRNVAVTHTTAYGKLISQALQRGAPGDVLFFAASGRASARRRGRVMLWFDAGPTAAQASEVALHLARRTGSELLVGFDAALFASEADVRARLAGLLERAPHSVQVNALAGARADSLAQAARDAHIARIVLGEGPLVSVESLEHLWRAFHGDLVLVR